MFAPFTRSMTFTLGLFSLVSSPELLAETDPERKPLELGATRISADNLGATTEHTGAYTTGSMSTATRLNLSVKDTPQSISVTTRQPPSPTSRVNTAASNRKPTIWPHA